MWADCASDTDSLLPEDAQGEVGPEGQADGEHMEDDDDMEAAYPDLLPSDDPATASAEQSALDSSTTSTPTSRVHWGPRQVTTARPKRLPKRRRHDAEEPDLKDPIDSLTADLASLQQQVTTTTATLRVEMINIMKEMLAQHNTQLTQQLAQHLQASRLGTEPGPAHPQQH